MFWLLQVDGATRSHSTSGPFSERFRQANLYMLALKVVTAKVRVVLNGSFTSQIKRDGTDINVIIRVTRAT